MRDKTQDKTYLKILYDTLAEILTSGVEHDDPRIGYLTISGSCYMVGSAQNVVRV